MAHRPGSLTDTIPVQQSKDGTEATIITNTETVEPTLKSEQTQAGIDSALKGADKKKESRAQGGEPNKGSDDPDHSRKK